MSDFWRQLASRRLDAGAREALGATRALAELALERKDWTLVEKLLGVIDLAMLPAPKKEEVVVPRVTGYGLCQDPECLGQGKEERRLYAVDNLNLCLGCRKRRKKETVPS